MDLTLLAFHGLLLSSQILAIIVEDWVHKWFNTDIEGLIIILLPVAFIVAVGFWILYPTKLEHYTFSITEIIVLNLLPIVFLSGSFILFHRRKSYLP